MNSFLNKAKRQKHRPIKMWSISLKIVLFLNCYGLALSNRSSWGIHFKVNTEAQAYNQTFAQLEVPKDPNKGKQSIWYSLQAL